MRSQVAAKICSDLSGRLDEASRTSGMTHVQFIILAVDRYFCAQRSGQHRFTTYESKGSRVRVSCRVPEMTMTQLRKISKDLGVTITDGLMLALNNLLATTDWRLSCN